MNKVLFDRTLAEIDAMSIDELEQSLIAAGIKAVRITPGDKATREGVLREIAVSVARIEQGDFEEVAAEED